MSLRHLLAVLTLLAPSHAIKWLLDSPGFDSADAWESEYLPCALEEVVFPEIYPAVLPLPQTVDVSGFVLPSDGALLLQTESIITLGGELKERNCENGRSRQAHLKPPTTRKWFDPRSWRSATAETENTAIPHMERVPCQNESVVISRAGPLSLDLEDVPHLRMGHMSLAGSLISSEYLRYLITTNIGQILFKNSVDVTVQFYHNDACGCQQDYPEFVEPICHNVVQSCERPHCLVPVTPLESCCAICGSVLQFSMDFCSDENLHKLRKLIAAAVKEQGLTDELDYYINYVNSPPYGNFLQAIVVDRESYSKQSVDFVSRLDSTTDWTKLFGGTHRLEVQHAGRPYNPNITFGSIMLIVLCLVLVSVVALVIIAHYAPHHRYLRHIPQWVYDPRRWRAFLLRSSVMFARFDNTAAGSAEPDMQESIVMGYDAESGEVRERERERAFDNPMFGEKPLSASSIADATAIGSNVATTSSAAPTTGRPVPTPTAAALIAKALPKAKEQKPAVKSAGTKLENVSLVDAMEGDEEQELAEIKLGNSTDEDSDDEKETKE